MASLIDRQRPLQRRGQIAAEPGLIAVGRRIAPGARTAALGASAREGAPLDPMLRARFEPNFGFDFSRVRIHSGTASAAAARGVGAQAFTIGEDIVLGAGQAPASFKGRHLLAHELAHVVQQGRGQSTPGAVQQGGLRSFAINPLSVPIASANGPAEQEAQHAASLATLGASPAGQLEPAPFSLQREALPTGGTPAHATEHVGGTLWATDPAGKPLPPSLDDISQGGVADCFLFASMAAIVNTHPQQIVDMIHDNGDGTFTVTFKGIGFWSSATQTVTADFDVGLHGNVTARRAIWPLVIEKAYAQQKGGIDKLGKGGNAGSALDDMLDDGPSRFDPREETADYIMGKLVKGKDKKWPMTILAPKRENATPDKKAVANNTPGLHFWHSYAIIDVDAVHNRIKLFNPWGSDHPNGDGWIDIEKVRTFFIEVDIND